MDGRVQDVVKNYMKENYGVNYVDMITEPGPNKILASPELAEGLVENIKKRVEVSVHHHGSKVVAIVGHDGCAGNPATKEEQIKHLQKAKEAVENFGMGVDVVLLYVNGDWTTVEKI